MIGHIVYLSRSYASNEDGVILRVFELNAIEGIIGFLESLFTLEETDRFRYCIPYAKLLYRRIKVERFCKSSR